MLSTLATRFRARKMSFPTILRRSLPTWLVWAVPLAAAADRRRGRATRRCPSREPRWRRASPRGEIVVVGGFTAGRRQLGARGRLLDRAQHAGAGSPTCPSRSTTPRRRARTAASTSSAATAATATRSRRPSCSGRTRPGGVSRRCPTPAPPRQPRSPAAGSTSSAASTAGAALARVAFALDLKTRRWARLPGPSPREHLAAAAAGTRVYAARRPQRRDRHEHDALRGLRRHARAAGRGSRRDPAGARRHRCGVRERPHRLDRRRAPAGDDRIGLRLRVEHDAAGSGSPTCPRRGTGSASSPRRPRLRRRRRAAAGADRQRRRRVAAAVARSGRCGARRSAATRRARRTGRSRSPRGSGSRRSCGPSVARIPISDEPSSPPATTSATTSRLATTSSLCMNSSSPLCTKPTSIWPSRTSWSTSWIWYGSSLRDLVQLPPAPAAPATPAVTGENRSTISSRAYGLRDLEDVELRVELDADGAERRDRLVEQHEPRRQLQVHRVDQLEASRITWIGSISARLAP